MKQKFEIEASTQELAFRLALEHVDTIRNEAEGPHIGYLQELRLTGVYARGNSWEKYKEVKMIWEFEAEFP